MAAPAQRRLLGHDADEQARGVTDLPAAPRPPPALERHPHPGDGRGAQTGAIPDLGKAAALLFSGHLQHPA